MSNQARGLERWMAARRPSRNPSTWFLWPIGEGADERSVARILWPRLRSTGASLKTATFEPGKGSPDAVAFPSRPEELERAAAVVIVSPLRTSTVMHAYRLFKELVAWSRRPRFGLVLTGTRSELDVETLAARLEALSSKQVGIRWHFLGVTGPGDSSASWRATAWSELSGGAAKEMAE